jgi:hypothetical protein
MSTSALHFTVLGKNCKVSVIVIFYGSVMKVINLTNLCGNLGPEAVKMMYSFMTLIALL